MNKAIEASNTNVKSRFIGDASVYRITAELNSPIIAMPYSLGLDSLLSAAVHELSGKIGHDAMSDVPIPATRFDDASGSQHILYHASCAYFANPVFFTKETILRARRRNEIGPEFFRGNKRCKDPWCVNQDTGDYKRLIPEYQVANTSALVWFVETNEPQLICDLLSSLTFLGKRRGQGFGELGAVNFSADSLPTSILDKDGYPLRPIPLQMWSDVFAGNKDARIEPSAGYSISAWNNDPVMCAMPQSPYFDVANAEIADIDGFVG